VTLAAGGFTGAPALLIESEAAAPVWRDLGSRWEIGQQYFKPHPVCRWSQPAVQAAADLMAQHPATVEDIAAVEVRTFAEAVRLGTRPPANTEEAQYALGFPVAAILTHGRLGIDEISTPGLKDPVVLGLLERIRLVEEAAFSQRFPQERLAAVEITLRGGKKLISLPTSARGDPENALSDQEVVQKFRRLTGDLSSDRRATIEQSVEALDSEASAVLALKNAILAAL